MSIEIVGLEKYQEFLDMYGGPIRYFHPDFELVALHGLYNVIDLDSLESFDEFPTNQGIYFCVRNMTTNCAEVWYVGKAGNFRSRWRQHHKFKALKAIQDVSVYCLILDGYSKEQISRAEQTYIDMLKPVFNDTSQPEKHLRLAS